MIPYNKYIMLYQLTESGNKVAKIVYLGKNKDQPKAVVTTNTYAFRIFASQLELDDVSYDFGESPESKDSVLYYIGKDHLLYTVIKRYPSIMIPEYVLNNKSYYTEVIFPETISGEKINPVFKYKFGRYAVILKSQVKSMYEVIDPKTLVENYKYKAI